MSQRPATGSLVDWLRAEAQRAFEPPIDDRQDQLALQWLDRELKQQDDSRLLDAVEALLCEGDPTVCTRLLELTLFGSPAFRSRVARALATAPASFAKPSTNSTRTLLGLAVRGLVGSNFAEPLPTPLSDVLSTIRDERDGWPANLATGLRLDRGRFVDVLVDAVERGTPAQLAEVAMTLVTTVDADGCEELLRAVGRRSGAEPRRRLAAAVVSAIEQLEEARDFLIRQGLQPKPGLVGSDLPRLLEALEGEPT